MQKSLIVPSCAGMLPTTCKRLYNLHIIVIYMGIRSVSNLLFSVWDSRKEKVQQHVKYSDVQNLHVVMLQIESSIPSRIVCVLINVLNNKIQNQ